MLSFEKRFLKKVVIIYYKNELNLKKGGFEKLSCLANLNGIKINKNNARILIRKWEQTGSVATVHSVSRGMAHCKCKNGQLVNLDSIVHRNRDITARIMKQKLKLSMSVRTVQKYLGLVNDVNICVCIM